MPLTNLEPRLLWNNFVKLNKVPRASKKEKKVIAFIKDFATKLNLEYKVDKAGNVLVKKKASKGMENKSIIVLQSHLDMVHQKNSNTDFDFDSQGIQMQVDEDWVKAKGTTLGADNGIGVAAMMALLESNDIAHPPLEALFTIDEETGMTGAMELQKDFLSGNILLNLDTEDDDELTIGCAGGLNINVEADYPEEELNGDVSFFNLSVKGLSGGHSGMDIHRGRGNANKIMNRLLFEISKEMDLFLNSILGGGLRNVIPRESEAQFAILKSKESSLKDLIEKFKQSIKAEHASSDPQLKIELNVSEAFDKVMQADYLKKFLEAIYAVPYGIWRMSPDMEGKVQTSNNLAQVKAHKGKFEGICLTRSSVDSEKSDVLNAIVSSFNIMKAKVNSSGSYPGWTPKPNSEVVNFMADLYKSKFNAEANVTACHAGLECGIIGSKYPKMDMISFGPNIKGAHSPDERVQISSVQKFWSFLLDSLKKMPSNS